MITREQIVDVLKPVNDPKLHKSIAELDMIDKIEVEGNHVSILIKLVTPDYPPKARIAEDITNAVKALDGVESVKVDFSSMSDKERAALANKQAGHPQKEKEIPHIANHLLAIASGKGGVGKSTVTANLARALAEQGHKVGILDADVYGFSIPRMLGITSDPIVSDNMIIPVEKDGIKVVSMGFFVPENTPVIWRGPLLHKTITQFMTDVLWENLDILLMDLPPGTGDVTITITQKLPKAEVIVVTTPQPAAVNVASRVAAMAEKTNLSVFGVIENMSYYLLPDNSRDYIFGKDGGKMLAKQINARFLGQIPLRMKIREYADSGKSLFKESDDNQVAEAYRAIAAGISGTF